MLGWLIRRRYGLTRLVAALIGIAVLIGGSGQGVDQLLRSARDGIRSHPASGEVVVVEIDRRSLDAISVWPWPRRYHGELVDRLHQAGARSIAFDVDFSATSNPADDQAFAAALQRAGGGVILPTLRQRESAGSSNFIDNLPATPLRDHGFLASVNVMPDPDGMVRRMPLGLETAGVPRPSLASMVAEQPAEIGRSFPIDYAIDPATIPHYSFVDILRGLVPAEQLRGKRILIGATAVEMGDRYPAPRFGVVPGVLIQALAAETLLAGPVPIDASGVWPLMLALILVFGVVRAGSGPARPLGFLAGAALILALPLAAEHMMRMSLPLAPALAALAIAAAGTFALDLAARFRQRALTDRDTGLANLAAFERAVGIGKTNIVVVARIERFAAIAAGLGPAATTNLIHRVADRLAFGHDQPIHRIDDDKLAWLDRGGDKPALEARLESLVALMRTPIDCGRLVDVTLNIGLAESADRAPKQQIANASLAAVRAGRGGERWNWFEDSSEETDWHLSLLGELDAAMATGDLWTAYQPKLDVATGRIVAVEALVRWQHPERGPIGPNQFIPLVEEHGRARDLTLYVFEGALRDAAQWRERGLDIAVAVNVSATLLLDGEFVGLLRDRLAGAPLPPERITIEVTESAAMKEPEQAIAALESWRALGLNISIDDYGTGQSSLGYLQKLPATELKIDMSFIRTLAADPRNAIMVRSTIAMAHELGMKVVAEGVEDGECLGLLAEMGCDTAQGWHIGKPMPAADLEQFLLERLRNAA